MKPDQPSLFESLPLPPSRLQLSDHDGATYTPALDRARLNAQTQRVFDVVIDGKWRTLAEIATITHDPEASVSARLRDLRKQKFGGFVVHRRRRGIEERGLFEYLIVIPQ